MNAANRAISLIQELGGGRVVEGAVDAYPKPLRPNPIRFSVPRANRILGTEIPAQQIKTYLERLVLGVQTENPSTLIVTPPSFRGDLEREIDLVEEVARLDGLESYAIKPDKITVKAGQPVTLKVTNEATFIPHNLVIKAPETGIDVKLDLRGGKSGAVSFTPTRAGSYEMVCDQQPPIGKSHKEKGMHGTLVVE